MHNIWYDIKCVNCLSPKIADYIKIIWKTFTAKYEALPEFLSYFNYYN